MSSTLDPAKLKVVELRQELSTRGLDTKGNKAALVKRLKDALDAEISEASGDTSKVEEESASDSNVKDDLPKDSEPPEKTKNEAGNLANSDKIETEPTEEPSENALEEIESPIKTETIVNEEKVINNEENIPITSEANGETPVEASQEEQKSRKSRWGHDADITQGTEETTSNSDVKEETIDDIEQRGQKRRRSSPSPERQHQRRRSKSPIKEDEPVLDNDKVQLSWYDSDLHLQIDNETFLSAKPLHEGAFGYAWAGVRANYGVSTGKVCYEVKIIEELKWEDFNTPAKFDHRKGSSQKKNKQANVESNKNNKLEDTTSKDANGDTSKVEEKKETNKVEAALAEESKNLEEIEKSQAEKVDCSTGNEEKLQNKQKAEEVEMEETKSEPIPTHLLRVGWSVTEAPLVLGEATYSYGYESSGKFVYNKQFQDYAIKFGVGDVVGAFLSIDAENIVISYTVNGEVQPNAATIPHIDLPDNCILYPHIASRNYVFEVNLGGKEPWFPVPVDLQDYVFLDKISEKVLGPVRPLSRGDCQVILMCGLPACGKTHWVREHIKANKDKRYFVIGNTQMLERMTVSGKPLKSVFKGRWSLLMDKLQMCINKMLEKAALRRKNYIIDQTNVFPSAQRRKLRPFEGFKRQAVVIVVSDEEQTKRQSLQEAQDGKEVPDSTILEMKANVSLPQKGEWLDEVVYAELDEETSKDKVQKYNAAGKEAGYGGGAKRIHRRDDGRWTRRSDHRGRNLRDKHYQSRYDYRGSSRHGHWQRPSGGWNRDRRDNRGPPTPIRDWRPRSSEVRLHERGGRDMNRVPSNNFNRNYGGGRAQGAWQGTGNGGWGGQGWNQQTFGHNHQWGQSGVASGSGSWNQNQWKYGGGASQSYGNYGGNWSYYGQYPQNWSSSGQQQGQNQTSTNTENSISTQGYSQQAWIRYAQQYAHGQAPHQHQAAQEKK